MNRRLSIILITYAVSLGPSVHADIFSATTGAYMGFQASYGAATYNYANANLSTINAYQQAQMQQQSAYNVAVMQAQQAAAAAGTVANTYNLAMRAGTAAAALNTNYANAQAANSAAFNTAVDNAYSSFGSSMSSLHGTYSGGSTDLAGSSPDSGNYGVAGAAAAVQAAGGLDLSVGESFLATDHLDMSLGGADDSFSAPGMMNSTPTSALGDFDTTMGNAFANGLTAARGSGLTDERLGQAAALGAQALADGDSSSAIRLTNLLENYASSRSALSGVASYSEWSAAMDQVDKALSNGLSEVQAGNNSSTANWNLNVDTDDSGVHSGLFDSIQDQGFTSVYQKGIDWYNLNVIQSYADDSTGNQAALTAALTNQVNSYLAGGASTNLNSASRAVLQAGVDHAAADANYNPWSNPVFSQTLAATSGLLAVSTASVTSAAALSCVNRNANLKNAGVLRFYNKKTGEHFYTLSLPEGCGAGYSLEGRAFVLFDPSTTGTHPLYRCYWPAAGRHFISVDANCEGQTKEGSYGNAYDNPVEGTAPIHRAFNTTNSDHFYTLDKTEIDQHPEYNYEGIAGYVIPSAAAAGPVLDAGRFQLPERTAVFYSDGQGAYCVFHSWEDYKSTGGKDDMSNVRNETSIPASMKNIGDCKVK